MLTILKLFSELNVLNDDQRYVTATYTDHPPHKGQYEKYQDEIYLEDRAN